MVETDKSEGRLGISILVWVGCVLLCCYIVIFRHFNVLFVETVSHYVALAGLEHRKIHVPLPHKLWH